MTIEVYHTGKPHEHGLMEALLLVCRLNRGQGG